MMSEAATLNVNLASIMQRLDALATCAIIGPDVELLPQNVKLASGIEWTALYRLWRFDANWSDVIIVRGKRDFRTTLRRINTCRDRDALRARKTLSEQSFSPTKGLTSLRHKEEKSGCAPPADGHAGQLLKAEFRPVGGIYRSKAEEERNADCERTVLGDYGL